MTKQNYIESMKLNFEALIDNLELDEMRKQFLRSRWLDQVMWLENRADVARRWYYLLRLTTIIGGVVIPALVSLNIGGQAATWLRWAVFCH